MTHEQMLDNLSAACTQASASVVSCTREHEAAEAALWAAEIFTRTAVAAKEKAEKDAEILALAYDFFKGILKVALA